MKYNSDFISKACQKWKKTKSFFAPKNFVSTSRPLKLLHTNLFGLVRTTFVSGKKYGLIFVDDYTI